MRIHLAAMLVVALTAIPLVAVAEDNSTNINLMSVTVLGRSGEQARLQTLARTALASLHDKFPETRTNRSLKIAAYIDFSKDEPEIRFAYLGRPGDKWFRITCTLSGQLRKCEALPYESSGGRGRVAPTIDNRRAKPRGREHSRRQSA